METGPRGSAIAPQCQPVTVGKVRMATVASLQRWLRGPGDGAHARPLVRRP